MKTALLEKHIQAAILEELTYRGIFHFRVNSGAFKTDRGGFYRMATPGVSDIIICHKGRFIAVEVKRPGNTLSVAQEAFKRDCERAGGVYVVAYGISDVMKVLQ